MTSYKSIDDDIHAKGFFIIDNFLSDAHYQALRCTINELYLDGTFKSAKIGQNMNVKQVASIRNDHICWLDEDMSNPAIKAYFSAIDNIKQTLNESLFLGLDSIEAHFAVYSTGSFYKKHVDQFANNLDRRISCVYYLNDNWQPEHGGELVLYQKDNKEALPYITLSPYGNRLVCFNSDLPHEVTMAYHTRCSIAAWLKVRALHSHVCV